jgi:Tfp pilus assembly protein PilV
MKILDFGFWILDFVSSPTAQVPSSKPEAPRLKSKIQNPKSKMRRGVSLLEVLISIFVILIGMLGVAAVIPAGRAELVEAAKADRSAACGAAAVQFLQTTGYFDPRKWIYYNGSGAYLVTQAGSVPGCGAIPFSGQNSGAFVVDPLYCARQVALGNTSNLNVFSIPPAGASTPPTVRVTYPASLTSATPLPQLIAERFFLCLDDLVIPAPKDRSERPRQFMGDSSAAPKNVAVPAHAADGVASTAPYLVRQVQGDYSWLFTISPLATQPDFLSGASPGTPYLNVGVGEYYSVSVAVFYKRSFNAPNYPTLSDISEPVGTATFFSTPSLGGGDVTLNIVAGKPASWLDVRQNEWILLGGYTNSTPQRYVLRWYRIVAVGDIAASARPATLAGPDWDLTGSAGGLTADVILYRGVVDVHTTTMKLTD